MEIDRSTLEALLARAAREAPRTSAERRAEQDVREALDRDYAALFPVEPGSGYYQPTLFDPKPYEV